MHEVSRFVGRKLRLAVNLLSLLAVLITGSILFSPSQAAFAARSDQITAVRQDSGGGDNHGSQWNRDRNDDRNHRDRDRDRDHRDRDRDHRDRDDRRHHRHHKHKKWVKCVWFDRHGDRHHGWCLVWRDR